MNKRYLTLIIMISSILYFPVMIISNDIPDIIKMESKVYSKHTKNIVNFPHKKHAIDKGIECIECHHIYEDGKNILKEDDEIKKCDTCHNEPKKPSNLKISKEENIKRFHYSAIHNNCKGCHQDLKKKKEPTGPISCNDCHKINDK
jgi:hypothetical protein